MYVRKIDLDKTRFYYLRFMTIIKIEESNFIILIANHELMFIDIFCYKNGNFSTTFTEYVYTDYNKKIPFSYKDILDYYRFSIKNGSLTLNINSNIEKEILKYVH